MKRKIATVCLVITMVAALSPAAAGYMLMEGFSPSLLERAVVAEAGTVQYRVQRGDTLWGIAREKHLDLQTIMVMNDLNESSILAEGQVLNLPYQRSRLYTVKKGDNPWKIASSFQISVEDLMEANNIKNPDRLQIGDKLIIPGSSSRGDRTSEGKTAVSRSMVSSLMWPIVGVITSGYGFRKTGFHHGLDIAAPRNAPIRAAGSGTVTFAGYKSVYGKTVIIDHGNGRQTLYGHAAKILVKKGQRVARGQIIARVGTTGNTTGPHLHFEVRVEGKTRNPLAFLR